MRAYDHAEYAHEYEQLQRTLKALASYMDALTQAKLITAYDDAAEALLVQFRAEYRALQNVTPSPYFARIDFVPYDEEESATHYLGKKGFEHAEQAVIDWRAPLAALFYKGKPGEVDYASPAGRVRGRMQLKRNLDIRAQELLTIADDFDIRTHRAGDTSAAEPGAYLREKLSTRRDPYLQDIIATIQAHQYELIQAQVDQVLVVQGVAGSGKTSVALHRLAYLLHPGNADSIEAGRCIVFGPNRLFLSYIGLVLPDLDIGLVMQTTLTEWACEQVGLDARQLADPALDAILAPGTPRHQRAAHYRRSRLRNSTNMGRLLERFVKRRRRPSLPDSGLLYADAGPLKVSVQLTGDRIAEVHQQFARLPLSQHRSRFIEAMTAELNRAYDEAVARRLDKMADEGKQFAGQAAHLREEAAQLQRLAILTRSLRDAALDEQNTARSLEQGAQGLLELAEHDQRRAESARAHVERVREDVHEARTRRRAIEQLSAQLTEDLERRWPRPDAVQDYVALLADRSLLAELGQDLFAPEEIALLHQGRPTSVDSIDLNDLPAIHFLHALGEGVAPRYDHIVVDEAQDVSRLQFEVLRRFSRNSSFTILGDLPQSIYAHRGIADWDEVHAAFDGLALNYHEITISYRTTYEITTLANSVLRTLGLASSRTRPAEAFERHADAPRLRALDDEAGLPAAVAESVSQMRAQGYENIAIITKTADAAVGLAVALYDYMESFEVIESAEVAYRGGLVVLPVHLAKGMEFEAGVVAGVDESTYTASESDGRLLYVAITRALHSLHLIWIGRASPHLRSVIEDGGST